MISKIWKQIRRVTDEEREEAFESLEKLRDHLRWLLKEGYDEDLSQALEHTETYRALLKERILNPSVACSLVAEIRILHNL